MFKKDILGYTGMFLLLAAYLFYVFNQPILFLTFNVIASTLLTLSAITKRDIPFIVVNGFIAILLASKLIKILLG